MTAPKPLPADIEMALREFEDAVAEFGDADLSVNPCPENEYERAEKALRTLLSGYVAQIREAEKLREFVEWCMATASFQGYDLHGGDMQDKAEELGLLVKAPADEAFREEYEADEMFVVAWSPLAARRADTPEEGK